MHHEMAHSPTCALHTALTTPPRRLACEMPLSRLDLLVMSSCSASIFSCAAASSAAFSASARSLACKVMERRKA